MVEVKFTPEGEDTPDSPYDPLDDVLSRSPTERPQTPVRTGVQYVVGRPPITPVLRPLRQTLYDRDTIGPGLTRLSFFADVYRRMDGSAKTLSDTNMNCAGQLGVPLEYDLVYCGISPAGVTREYESKWHQLIDKNPVVRWFFGGNTWWATAPMSQMLQHVYGFYHPKDEERPERFKLAEDVLQRINGTIPSRLFNMTTPDRKARRITSTESFRLDIEAMEGFHGVPELDVYGVMYGILYAQL